MATQLIARKHTLTGSTVTLLTIFGYPANGNPIWFQAVTFRAARTNTGDVFWYDKAGNQGGYLGPGEAATLDFGEGQSFMHEIQVSGTLNDQVYVSVDVNRYYVDAGIIT